MDIKECKECLEILLHSLERGISSEECNITILDNIKPSSFEFVIKSTINLLNSIKINGNRKDNYNDFKDFCTSDAEICKCCKNKDTEVCLRCSHFTF